MFAENQTLNITPDLIEQLKADEELCRNIYSCAQNQSRIADDVLALARINLDMLQFVHVSRTLVGASSDKTHPCPCATGAHYNTKENTGCCQAIRA